MPTDEGNQGRIDVYVSPGATWNFAGEWMASLDVRVKTFSHVVNGNAQLELPVVVELGIGRLFHLERGFDEATAPSSAGGGASGSVGGNPLAGADRRAAGDVLDVVQNGELAPLEPAPGKWTVFDFWAS